MNHVMVDIESLGTSPGSVIMSIGAVLFDPLGEWRVGDPSFDESISIDSCLRSGLTVDGGAIRFWLRDVSDEARDAIFGRPATPLKDVLSAFGRWWHAAGGKYVWSHGSNFDTVLLDSAFRAVGQEPPWRYRDILDTRTLFHLAPGYYDEKRYRESVRDGTAHSAIDDAVNQVHWVQAAYRLLREPYDTYLRQAVDR